MKRCKRVLRMLVGSSIRRPVRREERAEPVSVADSRVPGYREDLRLWHKLAA